MSLPKAGGRGVAAGHGNRLYGQDEHMLMGKGAGHWGHQALVRPAQVWTLPLIHCVTLNRSLFFSGPEMSSSIDWRVKLGGLCWSFELWRPVGRGAKRGCGPSCLTHGPQVPSRPSHWCQGRQLNRGCPPLGPQPGLTTPVQVLA